MENLWRYPLVRLLLWKDGIDAGQRVQGAGKADVGQALGEGVNKVFLAVSHVRVALHVRLDLTFAAAECAEDGESEEFPGRKSSPLRV